jgi:hypothetical protein
MNNKQLYQKNLFLQKSKDKFNPDVIMKKDEFDKNRKVNIFKKSTVTYNSITNQIPNNIKNQKDLELGKDSAITDLENIIMQKKKEREEQDILLKPQKQKLVLNDNINDNKNQDFNDLKTEQTQYLNTQKKIIETNKNKYDDIMNNLKDLGILNL